MTLENTRLIPVLRYRDPAAAIEWLCRALGFNQHFAAVQEGVIVHAQLRIGNELISSDPTARTINTECIVHCLCLERINLCTSRPTRMLTVIAPEPGRPALK
jgi:hypothetical protein